MPNLPGPVLSEKQTYPTGVESAAQARSGMKTFKLYLVPTSSYVLLRQLRVDDSDQELLKADQVIPTCVT